MQPSKSEYVNRIHVVQDQLLNAKRQGDEYLEILTLLCTTIKRHKFNYSNVHGVNLLTQINLTLVIRWSHYLLSHS